MVLSGHVSVNGEVVTEADKKINEDNKVTTAKITNKRPKLPNIKILYEDKDCIVIEKPAGILTHAKGASLEEATVSDWLNSYLKRESTTNRDLIVHRLDRATSGVMICAKNEEALKSLQKEFSSRRVKKHYIALIEGALSPEKAVIDIPIERDPKKPKLFRTSENGKPARTSYFSKAVSDRISRVELYPETGRTHQLRVHLKYMGHPIIGDTFYRGKSAKRMYLHANELELKLPDGLVRAFRSKLPKEFESVK